MRKIISGGQTGADRAALDFAIECGIEYGGFVPRGRRAEDGPLDAKYEGMTESSSDDYDVRTGLNVAAADLTVIVSHGPLTGGSLTTADCAQRLRKPCLHIDLDSVGIKAAGRLLSDKIEETRAETVNVAGPRLSEDHAIYQSVLLLLRAAMT